MTRDELHLWLLARQPRWLARLPYPLREGLAGLLLLALLPWMPPLLALALFLTLSGAYEILLSGPKVEDAFWRGIGALVVYVGWVICT